MQPALKFITRYKLVPLALCFIIFLICVVSFVEIAEEISEGETLWLDQAILNGINSYSSGFWDTFFVIVTQFGGSIAVVAITAALIALLALRRKYKKAIILGASVAGAAIINVVLKLIFARTRPDLWEQLVIETSNSFPSGHAMISTAIALAIIIICWSSRYRWPALILGVMYILVISFSRLYLGVHYPTDILAGWLVSSAWVIIVVVTINSLPQRRRVQPSQ